MVVIIRAPDSLSAYILEQKSVDYDLCGQSWPTVLVNKVTLEHSHTHLFTYCLQRLSRQDSRAEYSSCNRNHMVHKAEKYLLSSPFQRNCADPWSRVTVHKPNPACCLLPNDAQEMGKGLIQKDLAKSKPLYSQLQLFPFKTNVLINREYIYIYMQALFSFAFFCFDFPLYSARCIHII